MSGREGNKFDRSEFRTGKRTIFFGGASKKRGKEGKVE